ncbi:MAG: bis-aminopropyl spermidine synthase family protein [Caldisericia bacterium]
MERIREEIIMILSRNDTDFFEIVSKSNFTAKEVLLELKKLVDEKIIKEKDGVFSLENKLDKKISNSFLCDRCKGRRVFDNLNLWGDLIKEYDEITKKRPLPTNVYDQGVIDNESALSRFLYMLSRGDLFKKKIIILGDDDLMSILFSLSGIVDEVTVLEIDERLVNFINIIKKEKNLKNIEAYVYDARDPIDDIFKNRFDTFFTDPVETVEGLLIFVSRMVEALKGDRCSGYFGLTSIESNIDKWLRIQKSLNEMNLVITDIIRNFSYYKLSDNIVESDLLIVKENPFNIKNPEKIWYNSHLYRVEINGIKKPKYTGKVDLGRDLYFDEYTYVVKP